MQKWKKVCLIQTKMIFLFKKNIKMEKIRTFIITNVLVIIYYITNSKIHY